jgi:chromosome segregation ATPase
MDIDGIIVQFDEVEHKVERLIELCKSLEESNSELNGKIEDLQNQLNAKSENENRHNEQKEMILSKIDGLLSKLNHFSEEDNPESGDSQETHDG